MQLDLFPPPAAPLVTTPPDFNGSEKERLGWERRALSDMAERPLVCCYPGFMGAVCERLVAKGLATKEPAGFLPPPDLPPKKLKQMRWRSEDYPQFRYAPTIAGRAILTADAERAAA